MPELPEVETVRRVLSPQLCGLTVEEAVTGRPEVIAYPAADEFRSRMAGRTVTAVDRRGKFLIIRLDSGERAVVHLRMTGCLLLAPAELPPEKHTHVVLRLSGGRELRFSDMRRFGRLWLLREGEDGVCGLDALGPEPFDAGLSAGYLSARLGSSRRAVKECLLDQSVVAGIGNIYGDEILFAAGIAPDRPVRSLEREEWERLASMIPDRLAYFIEKNAITPQEYLETRGRDYRNTPFLQVYGHGGEPCPVCGAELRRAVIGGRGSVFCPQCQH